MIFLTAWSGCLTATLAFKTADFPIQLINSTNSTVARQANEAIARNLASDMKQMNTVPDPAVNQTENETGEANETAEGPEGMAGLGRSFHFAKYHKNTSYKVDSGREHHASAGSPKAAQYL